MTRKIIMFGKTGHKGNLLLQDKNIKNPPLVQPDNILLLPLHIKLAVMKNFVKAMDRNGNDFLYLKEKFSKLSDAKIKEGVLIGPQIRQLMKDAIFKEKLNDLEKSACPFS